MWAKSAVSDCILFTLCPKLPETSNKLNYSCLPNSSTDAPTHSNSHGGDV